jgi:hypothetical protein
MIKLLAVRTVVLGERSCVLPLLISVSLLALELLEAFLVQRVADPRVGGWLLWAI